MSRISSIILEYFSHSNKWQTQNSTVQYTQYSTATESLWWWWRWEEEKKERGDYVNFMAIWKMVGIGLEINDFSYFTSKRNFQDGNLQLLFEKPESIKEEIAQVHWRTKYNFRNDATVKWTHLCWTTHADIAGSIKTNDNGYQIWIHTVLHIHTYEQLREIPSRTNE